MCGSVGLSFLPRPGFARLVPKSTTEVWPLQMLAMIPLNLARPSDALGGSPSAAESLFALTSLVGNYLGCWGGGNSATSRIETVSASSW